MAKQYEIQLKFSTSGATDLIEALKNLAAEQNKVSAAQRKFNNANLKAVTATKKLLMAEEKHRSAMTKNSRQISLLNRKIEKLTFANKLLGVTTGKVVKAQNRMRISTGGLQRLIGSIRNKILLVTFAFGGMAAGIKSSVETSMQFEAVKVRLNSMFGSVRRGEEAFRKFNQVAATTPFTLTDVVEAGAALKAFGTNAEEMIKPTADLAAFMGVTATEAAQALGRAFAGGAGAADILRERGILQLIRDTKGIEDLSKMTLPDFRKALEETLLDPSVGIAGATEKLSKTLTGMVSNMADAFTRMKAAIGDFVNMKGIVETLTGAFEKLGERIRQANETPFETSIRHLQEMGVETTKLELTQAKIMKGRMEEAGVVKDLSLIEKEMEGFVNNKKIVLLEISRLQTDLFNKSTSEAQLRQRILDIDDNINNTSQKSSDARKKQLEDEKAKILVQLEDINNQRDILALIDEQIKNGKMTQDQAVEYQALVAKILGLEEQVTTEKKKQKKSTEELFELSKEQQKILDDGEKLRLEMREQLFTQHFDKVFSIAQKSINAQKQAELSALRDTDRFRNASAEERQDMEKDALKKLQKQQNMVFKLNQANEIVKTIMSTMETANKIRLMRDELKGLGTKLAATPGGQAASIRAFAGAAALSAQRGVVIASGTAQAGLIAGQKPPAFARGGSFITGGEQMITVGDNPGGRERVDITPISSPEFGDAGGSGSINVNIMGNVIGTQEFVRDNLLPEIENSIKRNLA